jgi:hypothetical protein
VADRVVEARWGSLNQWNVFDRTPGALRQWLLDSRGGVPRLLLTWPITAEPPLVRRSRSLTTVRNFLRVHGLGFAVEREEGSETRGGRFSAGGTPLSEIVQVGGWQQTRPIGQ